TLTTASIRWADDSRSAGASRPSSRRAPSRKRAPPTPPANTQILTGTQSSDGRAAGSPRAAASGACHTSPGVSRAARAAGNARSLLISLDLGDVHVCNHRCVIPPYRTTVRYRIGLGRQCVRPAHPAPGTYTTDEQRTTKG